MSKKNLAPNDPKRVPQIHRDLVQKMFKYFQDNGYTVSDTETITQSLSLLVFFSGKPDKFLQAAKTVAELAEMYIKVSKDIPLLRADLQLLGTMMTEIMNSQSLKDLEFKQL